MCLSVIWCFLNGLSAQEALSPRITNYTMDIRLDPNNKTLDCHTELLWRNPSDQPVDHVLMHIYYNAFRNSESTFMKERGVPEFLTQDIEEDCGWGYTDIIHMTDAQGRQLQMQYVQPDDHNDSDMSVLKVTLVEPVQADEELQLSFDWKSKVPKTMPRTGYNQDFYFFAQWFPKVGVYETAGMRYATEDGWNCHQYHARGEYYSDFGVYDVKMTVPEEYIVAASGALMGQEKQGNKKTWHFRAEDVIDFTWTCSPHFVKRTEQHNDVSISLYCYPEKTGFGDRYFNTIKYCMDYLNDYLGDYPYSTLSIIDPPIHGIFTGGMEYPTLITSLSLNCFPDGFKTVETLVVHEYIHQYFMQMIATHEVEDPWMDEGITTYYEGKILDSYMTDKTATVEFMGYQSGNKEWNRAEFFGQDNPEMGPNTLKSWEYEDNAYGPISYNKTAVWLETMEGLIGESAMEEVMRTYFQTWKFKHPDRDDFIAIANEVVSNKCPHFPYGLDWYFEQVLYGTGSCDYKVSSITNTEIQSPRGYFDNTDTCEIVDSDHAKYSSKVIVHRLESIQIPNTLRVRFEDGSHQDIEWNGKNNIESFEIKSAHKIISATIDPEFKITMDKNYLNNSLHAEEDKSGVRSFFARMITGAQHIMELMTVII